VDWRDALKPARGGCTLDVEVVPGSRESRFPAGFNAWRGRLEAKVKAPPEDGKANAELVGLVAEALGVPSATVSVGAGATSRRKSLRVEGLAPEEAARRLAKRF
jgi:uncharacterized protein (TIGR00251 family)